MKTLRTLRLVPLAILPLILSGCPRDPGNEDAVVTRLEPPEGAAAGGLTVTVVGENFENGPASVLFDGVPATDVEVLSDTQIRCVTPPGTLGRADVRVQSSGNIGTKEDAFEYLPAVESREAAQESGGNDDFADYERIPLNFDFQGYIGVDGDEDVYHFHPPADGKVKISLSWDESYAAGGIAGMRIDFYQGPDPTPDPDAFFGGFMVAAGDGSGPAPSIVEWERPAFLIALSHGPFVRVRGSAAGSHLGFDAERPYTLRIEYEEGETLEPAPQGDSFHVATALSTSSGSVDIEGNAAYDQDFDWFRFATTSSGWARVIVSAEGLGTLNSSGELVLNAKLFWQDPADPFGSLVYGVTGGNADAADRPGLTANVFEVEDLDANSTWLLRLRNVNGTALGAYGYDVTLETGDGGIESEEPGTLDDAETEFAANDLGVLTGGVDATATGYSFHYGDRDWFKFTTPSTVGSNLTITWNHTDLTSGGNGIGHFSTSTNPLGGEFALMVFDQTWFALPTHNVQIFETVGGNAYDVTAGEDVESVVVTPVLPDTTYYVLCDTVRGWSPTEAWTITVNVDP